MDSVTSRLATIDEENQVQAGSAGEVDVDPPLELRLLSVQVAGVSCGLPLDLVLEIHAAVQLTALPDAPDVVVGLVNRRGHPLPVLDLRRRLGLPSRAVQVEDRLVVLQLPDRAVALLVDAAVDVLEVTAAAVDAAVLRSTEAVRSSGVVVLPDGLLVVLDPSAFLSSSEAAVLEEALATALSATPA